MDKILIVDEDRNLLKSHKEGLDKMRQFEVVTAFDLEKAIESLSQNKISVLATVIDSPGVDGLELVAYMTHHRPSTPIVIMTDYGKPWYRNHANQSDFLYHIEKPFEIRSLASAIFVGLTLRDEGSNFNGVAMANLLPIIEAQRKSCKMIVESRGKGKGYLYFDDGKLINAHYQKLTGEKAALEMAKWDRLSIKFTDLPRRRIKKRVKTDLMELVGATWQKEELVDEDIRLFQKGVKESKNKGFIRKTLEQVLKRHIQEFRTINGYMAVGILNDKGEVLEHDTADDTIDFSRLVGSLNGFFSVSTDSTAQNELDKCLAFTLHTQKCIVLTITAEVLSTVNLRLVGLSDPEGNWFFMQHKMEKLMAKVLEALPRITE